MGALTITGLPAVAAATTNLPLTIFANTLTSTGQIFAITDGTTITMYSLAFVTGAITQLVDTNFANTTNITISGAYTQS